MTKGIDKSAVERYQELLSFGRDTIWTFQTFSDLDHTDKSVARTLEGTFLELKPKLEVLSEKGSGVFMAVNEFHGGRRRKETLKSIRCFWADFDSGKHSLSTLLGASPIEPTFVVESSPLKFHFYWVLTEPADKALADEYVNVEKGIFNFFKKYGIDEIHDVPRVLRLPGAWHKKEEPFQSTIVHTSDIYYDWDHVAESFPYVPTETALEPISFNGVRKNGDEYEMQVDDIRGFVSAWITKEGKTLASAPAGQRHAQLKRIMSSVHRFFFAPAMMNGICKGLMEAWHVCKPGCETEFMEMRSWCERTIEQEIHLKEYEAEEMDTPRPIHTIVPTQHGEMPFEIMPEGLMRDIVKYVEQRSHRKQPFLAFAAALTFCGMLFSRRWVHEDLKTRTHLYTIAVALTGAGKESPRKSLQSIVMDPDLDLKDLCQLQNIASAPGLFEDLAINPVQMLCIDEFQGFVDKITGANSAVWQREVKTELMQYFSSANSRIPPPKRKLGQERGNELYCVCPALSLYCTTTPKIYKSLKSGDVMDGFLNRFLVFESHVSPYSEDAIGSTTPSEKLITKVKKALNYGPSFYDTVLGSFEDKDGTNMAKSQVMRGDNECGQVTESIEAKLLRRKMTRKIEDRMNSTPVRDVWARTNEHMLKLAMILRLSKLDGKPEIQPDDIRWAYKVVTFCAGNMERLARENIAENPYDARFKYLLTRIQNHGSMFAAEWQTPRNNQDARIIKQLLEEGLVEKGKEKKTGPGARKIVYKYTGG